MYYKENIEQMLLGTMQVLYPLINWKCLITCVYRIASTIYNIYYTTIVIFLQLRN